MEKYNHYSFDLWLTLIKSNPEFKRRRDLMFYDLFNPTETPLEIISTIIRNVDIKSNECSEITQMHVPVERMIFDILQNLEVDKCDINSKTINIIKHRIQSLFISFPPSLYDEDTKNVIESLFGNGNILSIGSNTGFILGDTLDLVLTSLGIRKYFKFALYSDQMCISKPNPAFFDSIVSRSFSGSKKVHVGDNVIADGACVYSRIDYFQINSNENSIKDLL